MTQENTGEKEKEGQTPPQPSAEEQLNALRLELENTRTELGKVQDEAKAHQRVVSEKSEELRKREESENRVTELTARMDVLTTMIADIYDRGGESEVEPPHRRKSEELLRPLQDRGRLEREKISQQAYYSKAQEADKLAREVGLDMETSPELETAFLFFQTGNAEKGLAKTKEVVGRMKTEKAAGKPKETEEEMRARLKKEIEQQIREEGKYLIPESGSPSTTSSGFKEIEAAFAKGEIGQKEYNEARKKEGLR